MKENNKLLRECVSPHEFRQLSEDPKRKFDKKYKCIKCGGVIDHKRYEWYQLGLKHGKEL